MGAVKEQGIATAVEGTMDMQDKVKQKNLYQRMSAITSEIGYVAKNLKVEYGATKYKAVAEVDVLNAVKVAENKHGVYSYPYGREIVKDDTVVVGSKDNVRLRIETVYRFVNIDNPSEYLDITTYGDGIDSMDKAPGKAMTYGDKYALLKAYKIQTGDDPDANASQETKVKTITDIQIKTLKAFGLDDSKLQEMAVFFKVKAVADIPYDKAELQIKALEKKQGTKKPEQPAYDDLVNEQGGAE